MSKSPSDSPTNPEKPAAPLSARPHRRLALLQSTQNSAAPPDPAPLADDGATSEPVSVATDNPATSQTALPTASETVRGETVRVMAYLSPAEARVLDETWLRLRAHPSRPSKSDILRAACALAAQDFDQLAAILTQQQSGTLSRQRSSKMRREAR